MEKKIRLPAKIKLLEAEIAKLGDDRKAKGANTGSHPKLNALLAELAAERGRAIERLTARLAAANDKLKSSRERAATTVHDLKVPITISLLNLELTEMESGEKEQRNYMTSVRRELEFLLDTIGNLLDIEHGESGRLELRREKVKLHPLVDGVIARVNVLINDKPELAILNNLPKRLPALYADRKLLVRLFNNLLSNSVKYTEQGTIRVGAKTNREKKSLTLFVRDSGAGIEPDRLPQLFKFFRGDALRQDSSGVGLAFVKQVVTAHQGRVWLESERGVGTTVFVELPRG